VRRRLGGLGGVQFGRAQGVLDGVDQVSIAELSGPAEYFQRIRFVGNRVRYADPVARQHPPQLGCNGWRWVAGEDAAHGSVEVEQQRASAGEQFGQAPLVVGRHDLYSRAMLLHSESNQAREASTNCVPDAVSSSVTA